MTERDAQEILKMLPDEGLHGRRKILTDATAITEENVADVVGKSNDIHRINRMEINYLLGVYKGRQDIRNRNKTVRPEIRNVVTVNRANEIVTFKTSYLLGEPLQYVSRGGDDATSEKINSLNEFMYSEDKAAKDKEVADWFHICGVAPRMVTPDEEGEEDGSPANIITLDPRDAYVIYSSNVGQKAMAGVLNRKDEDGQWFQCVYTKNDYFEIKAGKVTGHKLRTVPYVPILEYVNNDARMGAFEVVLPILNAINTLESNRIDDIEQFVQSIMVFENCDISDKDASELLRKFGIKIKSDPSNPAKIYRVEGNIDQGGVQNVVDDLTDAYITICGMPNRNGGSSTSDTGAAVIMRDGWSAAESRAKDSELFFCRSEREVLRIFLYICRETGKVDLRLADIGMKFTRRNYADIQSKAQVLCELLANGKVHPKLAFQVCGLFTDSEEAYRMSMEWVEEQSAMEEKRLEEELERERLAVHESGQDDQEPSEESGPEVSDG